MKDHYEVTIGIPVYKSADYIHETLCSVLNQSFEDIEFLIIDDCGGDDSMGEVSIFQRTHPRGGDIRVLNNNRNRGVSYSRNLIIDEAKGHYLFFMDSDDIVEPYTIQILYNALINNLAQVAYGSYEIVDKVGNAPMRVYQKDTMVLKGDNELALYAFKNNDVFHVSVCNFLIDLRFLRQAGLRFVDADYWEDMVFTTELVTIVNKAVLLSDVTYHYIRRPGSLSHYQKRLSLNKHEILKTVSVIDYLKDKCQSMRGRPYLTYLGYNLEMISFYMVCNILKSFRRIVPRFTYKEMRDIMCHPLQIQDIIGNRHRMMANVVFYLFGKMPICLFFPSIWLAGKIKKAL